MLAEVDSLIDHYRVTFRVLDHRRFGNGIAMRAICLISSQLQVKVFVEIRLRVDLISLRLTLVFKEDLYGSWLFIIVICISDDPLCHPEDLLVSTFEQGPVLLVSFALQIYKVSLDALNCIGLQLRDTKHFLLLLVYLQEGDQVLLCAPILDKYHLIAFEVLDQVFVTQFLLNESQLVICEKHLPLGVQVDCLKVRVYLFELQADELGTLATADQALLHFIDMGSLFLDADWWSQV